MPASGPGRAGPEEAVGALCPEPWGFCLGQDTGEVGTVAGPGGGSTTPRLPWAWPPPAHQ